MTKISTQERGELIIQRKCTLTHPGHGNARYLLKDDLETHVHYFIDYTLDQIKEFQYPGLHVAFDDIAQSPRPWIRVYYTLKCGTTVATIIPRTKTGVYPTKSKILPAGNDF